jgi:hypothetical protein
MMSLKVKNCFSGLLFLVWLSLAAKRSAAAFLPVFGVIDTPYFT